MPAPSPAASPAASSAPSAASTQATAAVPSAGSREQSPSQPAALDAAYSPNQRFPSLCVEGWRDLNHSYSLVNQWQLSEFLKLPLRLRHRDLPPFSPNWNRHVHASGLPPEVVEQLMAIPEPEADEPFDAVYRIAFPIDLSVGSDSRLFVFATSEYGVSDGMLVGKSVEAFNASDAVSLITPSSWSRLGFAQAGFLPEKISVIPHAVDPQCFYRVESDLREFYRQLFGFGPDDFVLLSIGALTTNKGIDLLLSAFEALKRKAPSLKLVIKDQSLLYKRSLSDVLREMLLRGGQGLPSEEMLGDIVIISENLDIEALRSLYNSCDAYVSPYRAEGFNLPPLEAAACGLPILVTAGGSTDDYFSAELGLQIDSQYHQWEGLHALDPSLDSLIAGIEQLMASAGAWGGEDGSRLVHQRFNWEVIAQRLLARMALG